MRNKEIFLPVIYQHYSADAQLTLMGEIVYQNGWRSVKPYFYTAVNNCKHRWVNKTVIDVLCAEFRSIPREFHYKSIENGTVELVKNRSRGTRTPEVKIRGPSLLETKIQMGDILICQVHKHERSVPVEPIGGRYPIDILHNSESFLVVSKPAGIPTHPSGWYYHNSLISILQEEYGFGSLFPVHRLDLPTSGVQIFAKSAEAASARAKMIRDRSVQKFYLARVNGVPPPGPKQMASPLVSIRNFVSPIDSVSVLEAETVFLPLWSDSSSQETVVLASPLTGRYHQIRIHLRDWGYPIVNDALYGVEGLYTKENTSRFRQLARDFFLLRQKEEKLFDSSEKLKESKHPLVVDYLAEFDTLENMQRLKDAEKRNGVADIRCEECGYLLPVDLETSEKKPQMRLHSLRYRHKPGHSADCESWDYISPLPEWAVSPSFNSIDWDRRLSQIHLITHKQTMDTTNL